MDFARYASPISPHRISYTAGSSFLTTPKWICAGEGSDISHSNAGTAWYWIETTDSRFVDVAKVEPGEPESLT